MKKCINCGFESDFKYCPKCGENIDIKRLNIKAIFRDGTHRIFHWENPSLNTIRLLLTKPGTTTKNYISGIRKSVIKPYKFFLSFQTLHVLIFHWLNKYYFDYTNSATISTESSQKEIIHIQQLLDANVKYFDYLIPVFFAFFFFLFYKKKTGVNFAESLAASFYWISITLIFSILCMFLSFLYIRLWNAAIIINSVYLVIAILQFVNVYNFKEVLKSTVTVILSYLTFLIFVSIIILLYTNYYQK